MRTIAPVMIVFCIGAAGAMLAGAGFYDAWGASAPGVQGASEELETAGTEANPNQQPGKEEDGGSIEGQLSGGDSGLIGLIKDAADSITAFASAVALFPVTMIELGFPVWFVTPLASMAYLITGVGVVQFTVNRKWV